MRCSAVTHFGQALETIERPTPEPTGSEVLMRVTRCGVCHSDVHLRHGYFDLGSAGRISMADRGISLPMVLGHEVLGEVVSAGPDAKDAPPSGSTRLVYPWMGCGKCHVCLAGGDHTCAQQTSIGIFRSGGYGEYVVVPHPRYLLDVEGLDPSVAATYACSGLTAYSAAKKVLPLPDGAWTVIVGAGGLGLNALAILRAMDIERIAVADIDRGKLDAAKKAGADVVIDSGRDDAVKQLQDATGNRAEAILDFVGATASARFSLAALPKGGRYVLIGLHGGDLTLGLPSLVLRALTVYGSLQGSLQELHELVDLAKSKGIDALPITELPHADAGKALDRLEKGDIVGRMVLAT